ncbi:hypothetical protein BC835DRAFT_1311267 [Cytidiella melzeri]|nr:hypothetical protein BC835DRAFT_1311267 [Cytidiella melzeri]
MPRLVSFASLYVHVEYRRALNGQVTGVFGLDTVTGVCTSARALEIHFSPCERSPNTCGPTAQILAVGSASGTERGLGRFGESSFAKRETSNAILAIMDPIETTANAKRGSSCPTKVFSSSTQSTGTSAAVLGTGCKAVAGSTCWCARNAYSRLAVATIVPSQIAVRWYDPTSSLVDSSADPLTCAQAEAAVGVLAKDDSACKIGWEGHDKELGA